MFSAHASHVCFSGAAISRTWLLAATAVFLTRTSFPLCVGAAVADTALTVCTMFAAQAPHLCFSGAAISRTWFHNTTAVLRTEATFISCVGAAIAGTALASCAMFVAHASRMCVGGAPIN